MAQHNRVVRILTFVALLVLVLAPLTAEAGGIGGAFADLCKKIDCTCIGPNVKQVMLFSDFTPNGYVAIKGCGFGSYGTGSKLRLVGDAPAPYKLDVTLEIKEWQGGLIGAHIPVNVTGVTDQPAKFYVVTKNNVQSNQSQQVQFRAAQDIKLLPMADVKSWCSTEADEDWCNGTKADSTPFCFATFGISTDGSASAQHYTCHDWIGDDNGTDEFQATLTNGWVFDHLDWTKVTCGSDKCGDSTGSTVWWPAGFQKDTTWTKVTVDWNTNNYHGYAGYNIYMYIIGPAGVPHK
jgi:hypothetical protein